MARGIGRGVHHCPETPLASELMLMYVDIGDDYKQMRSYSVIFFVHEPYMYNSRIYIVF